MAVDRGVYGIVLVITVFVASLISLISLETMVVNVVTQSPFFLYGNVHYDASLIATLLIVVFMAYVLRSRYVVIPLMVLWALTLLAPYMIYIHSLPIYNDQLGFVGEALSGILYGYVEPLQGEPSSLGHAYFTSILTVLMGVNPPIWGIVLVQSLLPIAYALPLLALPYRDTKEIALIMLVVLGAMLNPILYGRTPFAWSYLVLFTAFLYNRLNELGNKRGLGIAAIMILIIIYAAYVISDPTSLMVPIILVALTIFRREFLPLTLATMVTWFAINLILYISGSLSSVIMQLMAMIESPTNPVPSLVLPAVNPVMRLYDYAREFTVFIGFLIGLIASSVVLIDVFRRRGRVNNGLTWVTLYLVLVVPQAAALVMSRWGMVPYSMYVISALPILTLLLVRRSKWLQVLVLALAIVLVVLSPVVKWGFSVIAFPTTHDIHEALFIMSYVGNNEVCASGAHELLWFYYWLYNIDSPINYLNPTFTPSQATNCDITAVFYRAFNTYRLDITTEHLNNELNAMNNAFNVVYKDGLWTIWSR